MLNECNDGCDKEPHAPWFECKHSGWIQWNIPNSNDDAMRSRICWLSIELTCDVAVFCAPYPTLAIWSGWKILFLFVACFWSTVSKNPFSVALDTEGWKISPLASTQPSMLMNSMILFHCEWYFVDTSAATSAATVQPNSSSIQLILSSSTWHIAGHCFKRKRPTMSNFNDIFFVNKPNQNANASAGASNPLDAWWLYVCVCVYVGLSISPYDAAHEYPNSTCGMWYKRHIR